MVAKSSSSALCLKTRKVVYIVLLVCTLIVIGFGAWMLVTLAQRDLLDKFHQQVQPMMGPLIYSVVITIITCVWSLVALSVRKVTVLLELIVIVTLMLNEIGLLIYTCLALEDYTNAISSAIKWLMLCLLLNCVVQAKRRGGAGAWKMYTRDLLLPDSEDNMRAHVREQLVSGGQGFHPHEDQGYHMKNNTRA